VSVLLSPWALVLLSPWALVLLSPWALVLLSPWAVRMWLLALPYQTRKPLPAESEPLLSLESL
jgi:hypothetical protein